MVFVKPIPLLALALAFAAGLVASPMAHRWVAEARAESAPLSAAVIDLNQIHHADLPGTPNPEMNGKSFVVTDNATVGIQSGNVARHKHPNTDEIQLILEGSGAMWLGDERREFKPGTLLIIPKGVAHAGTVVASGPVKALVIKIPPQGKDDTVFLN
jgi:mannose-6-phosphate isomerase-like protein (cupin superfamily)